MNLEAAIQLTACDTGGWIGVDLDGTLAHHTQGAGIIGKPIPKMVAKVKKKLRQGVDVRIFTARLALDKTGAVKKEIQQWTKKVFGRALPVTNVKDHKMIELWDDKARQVKKNKGVFASVQQALTAGGPGSGRHPELGAQPQIHHLRSGYRFEHGKVAHKDARGKWLVSDRGSKWRSMHGDELPKLMALPHAGIRGSKKKIKADQSTGEWTQVFFNIQPISNDHPPSLRNPIRTKIPTAQEGWKAAGKNKRKQAMEDLRSIHQRLRRQFGKPEIAQGANYPLFPNIATNF